MNVLPWTRSFRWIALVAVALSFGVAAALVGTASPSPAYASSAAEGSTEVAAVCWNANGYGAPPDCAGAPARQVFPAAGDGTSDTDAPPTEEAPEESHTTPDTGRLGLHYTASELAVWRDRAQNGPYRARGDAFPDSPGEWQRVEALTAEFMRDPNGMLAWLPSTSGCWTRESANAAGWRQRENRNSTARVTAAAFYALVMDDDDVRQTVRSTLLAQLSAPGVEFTDDRTFCTPMAQSGGGFDSSPAFSATHWMTGLLHAYDYVKDSFTPEEQARVHEWHAGFAHWLEANTTPTMEQPFVDRYARDYTLRPAFQAPQPIGWMNNRLWAYAADASDVRVDAIHNRYNNRWAAMMRYAGLVGIQTDDALLRDRATLWFEEFIRFGVYPNGAYTDFHRGSGTSEQSAQAGLEYTTAALAHAISYVDALARTGDTSLYDFRTTEGAHGTEGRVDHGEAKSYLYLIQSVARHYDGTYERYWSDTPSESRRINGQPSRGLQWRGIQANVYYRDTLSRALYRHDTTAGMPAWSDPPGLGDWGDSGAFPAMFLMFADMEDRDFDPYGG